MRGDELAESERYPEHPDPSGSAHPNGARGRDRGGFSDATCHEVEERERITRHPFLGILADNGPWAASRLAKSTFGQLGGRLRSRFSRLQQLVRSSISTRASAATASKSFGR